MARLARGGAIVVRLKGGDPSIYGRAAEERRFLETAGVDVEVVPGITSASAAAAEFGFSLTTRAGARRVMFATGRTLSGMSDDWSAAADNETTLCLYMGCADIAGIAQRLMSAGRDPATPAVATIDISRPGSRLIASTLGLIAADLKIEASASPVLIVIGGACADAVNRAATSQPPAPNLRAC